MYDEIAPVDPSGDNLLNIRVSLGMYTARVFIGVNPVIQMRR